MKNLLSKYAWQTGLVLLVVNMLATASIFWLGIGIGVVFISCAAGAFAYFLHSLLKSRDKHEEIGLRMEHLAYHDALTGLPNRRLFEDRLNLALVRAKRSGQIAAVMFLDLDRFKMVNDSLGHACGDELIRITGERLQSCLREGDTVYRQGGDEFTLLLENISKPADVRLVAGRIHAAMDIPYSLNGLEHHITASVGISLYPTDGETLDELIKHADKAMYGAKKRGRNNFQFFASGLDTLMTYKHELETALRLALDNGELEMHYQPQYALSNKRIIGVEAMIHWNRAGKQFSSNEWLAVAEETGLIISIGEWALQTACLKAKQWQAVGFQPLKLSIGLSVAQFKKENLVERISEILAEVGLDAKYLELDLAEGISMLSVQSVGEKLRLLKQLGLRIAMDDVCAGIFSGSSSQQVPMDTIKLDSSLIRNLPEDLENQTLAVAIIEMAERLHLNLIAKGVESQEQLAHLYKLRCKEVQGELLSGPLMDSDFEHLMQQQAG
ncbi:EAL domain-containing protein [Paenibacillus sp. GP183]|uniref:putative bifunctional diguanylate cyclase/phosphodiesterase n=1 Tax=Paenibacillus sp. GP183 TaxID=1882751 RepID=UPI000898B510|nr:EAL domain-containing protein [Paenibacillus sp. GP183]SEC23934.1 diguanylate cyclase (GGDEF) domain-containing protein [Paenibacillus sp. GP183]